MINLLFVLTNQQKKKVITNKVKMRKLKQSINDGATNK